MAALVFVDTNILLDFYRLRGREKGLSILDHIDGNLDHFITGSQIEMEFKKNRQRVILESQQSIKPPDFGGLKKLPGFLAHSKQSSGLVTSEKRIRDLSDTLRQRIERVLNEPTRYDRVYKTAQRLFRHKSPYNLSRDKKIRNRIRSLARKRFSLGYPPRKNADTSIGDAVNWEWIIHCAAESGQDIVIVTRDSDYGVTFGGHFVLNDWLRQEFKERVSRRRDIMLTDRLSEGLKTADIDVSEKEAEEEEEFLEEQKEDLLAAIRTARGAAAQLQLNDQAFRDVAAQLQLNDQAFRDAIKATAGFDLSEIGRQIAEFGRWYKDLSIPTLPRDDDASGDGED